MRKATSTCLALFIVAASAVTLAPSAAEGATSCLLSAQPPFGTGDGWVGTGPTEVPVPGGPTVGVPGAKIRVCNEWYGDGNLMNATQWASVRIEPGVCDADPVHDNTCFTAYLESSGLIGYSQWSVQYATSDGTAGSIVLNVPPLPRGASICLISMGYRAAPTRDCEIVWDMGQ